MTEAFMLFVAVCVWTWSVADLVDGLLSRRRDRALNRAIDEAIALTEPIGPEDRPDWGSR